MREVHNIGKSSCYAFTYYCRSFKELFQKFSVKDLLTKLNIRLVQPSLFKVPELFSQGRSIPRIYIDSGAVLAKWIPVHENSFLF